MKYTTSIFALIPLVLSSTTQAAGMDETVVTATRYEKNLSDIGSSISVITADDIEKSQAMFVQDLLQNVPGISLNQNGSFGGLSTVKIRGASSSQTVILIDGVQINDVTSTGGEYNFANLDPNGIERIEILRGPQSILYGSDAIGGVINIITKSGSDGLGGSAFIEGGSYDTFRGGANLHGGTDKINFNFSASAITSDGISKADENDGNVEKDGYKNISLQGKVTARASELVTTEILARYSDSESDLDGFGPIDGGAVAFTEEFMIAGRVHADLLDGRFKNSFSLEYSKTDRYNDNDGFISGEAEGSRLNFDYFGRYTVNDDIGVSIGAQHEGTKASTLSEEKFNIDSLLSEVSFQGIAGLTLTGGLRYDNHNRYGDTLTPRVTGSYQLGESATRLFANWGEGFKAPSVFQLTFFCCGAAGPNIDLEPEESKGWEVGVEQSFLEDDVIFTATYFQQNFKNMIDFANGAYTNINRVRAKGVELSAQAQLFDQISLNANYTYTDSIDRETGETLAGVPSNAAFGQVSWQATPDVNIAASLTYNGKELPRGYSAGVDGWVRFDLRASYDITEQITVYGRVDNLFDKEYQQIAGFGTPDRSAYIGLRGKF